MFITTVTLAEVWQGFHSLPLNHADYAKIKSFVQELPRHYRVLNFDARAAALWGKLTTQVAGPLPLRDSLIAAIALSRGYRVATRDVSPFERAGCKVINPWRVAHDPTRFPDSHVPARDVWTRDERRFSPVLFGLESVCL